MKEFFKSPKKTAILGLVGSILMLIELIVEIIMYIRYISPLSLLRDILFNIFSIGMTIYFIILLMRFKHKNIHINIANCILIVTSILYVIFVMLGRNDTFFGIIQAILQVIISVYFISLFFNTKIPINNKVFVIISIINIVVYVYSSTRFYPLPYNFVYKLIFYMGYLLTIPYFYNYYNLLKGGTKNGK